WDQSCCTSWIIGEGELVNVLDALGCRDVNDVDDYVKKYHLSDLSNTRKANYHSFKKAAKYRQALRSLDPVPNPKELDAAADLHAHLIKRGRMRNFFDASINLQIGQYNVVSKFDPGPILVGGMDRDNLKIPIFPRLFRRQQTPRECIVCTEEK